MSGRIAFERLARRVLAIGRGAKTSGLDARAMIERLESARDDAANAKEVEVATTMETGEGQPAALAAVPAERIVDVDVRDVLRAGGEPFGQIMAARQALPSGGVLRVRAIFEPAPLYFVLGAQGFGHWTEQLAEDDWRVWFFESAANPAAAAAPAGDVVPEATTSAAGHDGDVVILDVRGLEPPEPMVRTLEALELLPAGKTLVQINVRAPKFLLPMLENRGFRYEIREQDATLVRTFIRRA